MYKLKKISLLAIIGLALVLIIPSCYTYNDDTYLDELDLTLTYYDTNFNFQSYGTFAIRDSVGVVSNYLSDNDLDDFYRPGGGSDKIKNEVRQQFLNLGYTEVADDEDYDFGVNLVIALIDNTYVVGYPGWWYGYYDYYSWYWGGWYPYYPYYPWYYTTYSYQTGTLLMEMADGESVRAYRSWAADKTDEEIENADPDEVPDVMFRWQALINGVAGYDASYNNDRTERGIDEAFSQSPYLEKN
jgi:hypothetical protein